MLQEDESLWYHFTDGLSPQDKKNPEWWTEFKIKALLRLLKSEKRNIHDMNLTYDERQPAMFPETGNAQFGKNWFKRVGMTCFSFWKVF